MDFYSKKAPQNDCRLCLEVLYDVSEGKFINDDMEMKINDLFTSNVLRVPTVPSLLCSACYINVNDFHYFITTIIEKHQSYINGETFEVCEIKPEQLDFSPVVNITAIKEEDLADYEWNEPWINDADERTSENVQDTESESDKEELEIPKSQNNLHNVLREIDKGTSITNAALKFNISESHLKDFSDKFASPEEFETKIADWIVTSGEMGDPKTKQNVLDAATHLSKLESSTISCEFNDSWFRNFLQRNPGVLLPKPLDFKAFSEDTTEAAKKASENSENELDWIDEQTLFAGKKKFSQKELKLALEEIKNGATIRSTAWKYKISKNTLARKRQQGLNRKRSQPFLVSHEFEKRFADWIVSCNELGDIKERLDVRRSVNHLIKIQNRRIDADKLEIFVDSFSRRHPETVFGQKLEDVPNFVCDLCGKTFLYRFRLHNHMRKVHYGKKADFKCKICEKTFTTTWMLKEHVLAQHPEPGRAKNFICDTCGKEFYTLRSQKTHSNSHKERKFHCDIEGCDKKFFTAFPLEKHKQSDHYGIKEFKCDYPGCNKAYGYRQRLRRHEVETHLEKPKCPVNNCTFRVGRTSYMRKHLKSHTEIDSQELTRYLLSVRNMNLAS